MTTNKGKLTLVLLLGYHSLLIAQNTWTTYTTSNSGISGNHLNVVKIDGHQKKWIGTSSSDTRGSLNIFNDTSWVIYNVDNSSYPGENNYDMAIDANDTKWIGTSSGLVKFESNGGWTLFSKFNSGLPDNHIRCIQIDSDGNKWIGTDKGGLAFFDDNSWVVYDTVNSQIPYNEVACIGIDHNDIVWTGHNGAFATFDGTNWTVTNTPGGSGVSAFYVDENNNIWTAYYSTVRKYDGSQWTSYHSNNWGASFDFIQSITKDLTGNIWIGTTQSGLVKFTGTDWEVFDTSNSGITSNFIFSIAIDGNNQKWIATDNGLAVLKESVVNSISKKKSKVSTFEIYPNPASDNVTIDFSSFTDRVNFIFVKNIVGEEVKSYQPKGEKRFQFSTSFLPSGIYTVELAMNETILQQKLVIK